MLIVLEMFRLLLGLCSGDIGKWKGKGFNFVFKKDALDLKLHEASLLQPGSKAIAAFLTSGVFSQSELSSNNNNPVFSAQSYQAEQGWDTAGRENYSP